MTAGYARQEKRQAGGAHEMTWPTGASWFGGYVGTEYPNLSKRVGVGVYGLPMKHAGYAHPDEQSVTLRQSLCDVLGKPACTAQFSNAVYVLAHELGHVLVPTNDEWKADQYAVRHFKSVARKLGLPRRKTHKLWRLCPYR